LSRAWLCDTACPGYNANADINQSPDGMIDALDLALVADCWLRLP